MIQQITDRLVAAGIDAVPSSYADPSLADTAVTVVNLINGLVDGRAYPLKLPESPAMPNAVYQAQARNFLDADGHLLGRVDVYVAAFRSQRFAELQQLTEQLDQAVSEYQGMDSIEITDAAQEYEDEQQQYRAYFELQVATLATSTPSLPAAFAHQVSTEAAEPATTCRHQTATEFVAVVLIATQDTIDQVRRDAMAALIGISTDESITPLEYVGGQQVAVSGRHVYWRELLRWQRRIPT